MQGDDDITVRADLMMRTLCRRPSVVDGPVVSGFHFERSLMISVSGTSAPRWNTVFALGRSHRSAAASGGARGRYLGRLPEAHQSADHGRGDAVSDREKVEGADDLNRVPVRLRAGAA